MITHEMSCDEARSISMYLFASLKIDLTDCSHLQIMPSDCAPLVLRTSPKFQRIVRYDSDYYNRYRSDIIAHVFDRTAIGV